MEALANRTHRFEVEESLAIDYSRRVLTPGVHGVLTTEFPDFFEGPLKLQAERFGVTQPETEKALDFAVIDDLTLLDSDGAMYQFPVRVQLGKTNRQYKATVRLHGEYFLTNDFSVSFPSEMDVNVFFNTLGHRGGFATIAGIFTDKQGHCGKTSDGKSLRIVGAGLKTVFTQKTH